MSIQPKSRKRLSPRARRVIARAGIAVDIAAVALVFLFYRPGRDTGLLVSISVFATVSCIGFLIYLGSSARQRHAAGGPPADEPWARTSDRSVWRAYKNGLTLTVTHIIGGGWVAEVEGPGVSEQSDPFDAMALAQHWADDQAGGAR
jgi:hypothetical protein